MKRSVCQEWALQHQDVQKPEDLLHFVYLDEFQDDWKQIFGNDEDEEALWALEILIMSDPLVGAVVRGTGGLRKVRFGTEQDGKRGANRICYAFYPEHHLVLMVMAYGKNRRVDISSLEREGIKEYLQQVQKWLDRA